MTINDFLELEVNMDGYIYSGQGDYYYHEDTPSVWLKIKEPNIKVMEQLITANTVIDPLLWELKFLDVTNVSYQKYLALMKYKAKITDNNKILTLIEEYEL